MNAYVLLGAGIAALAAAVSGWVYAWRARGETNAAGDRARIAESKAEGLLTRVAGAEAEASVAVTQWKAAQVTIGDLELQVIRLRSERTDLLEKLALLGAPVGDALYDSTLARLYADRDRSGGGQGAGPGGGADPVSGDRPTVASIIAPKK